MSYFSEYYSKIRYPIGETGLRNAQIGAVHSIASYFTLKQSKPAIVVMPTGSGKTIVLMMSPYILQITRLLVITPSRLVREQIAKGFLDLYKLRELNILSSEVRNPAVKEITSKILTLNDWYDLREFEVVVGCPNCLSPEYEVIPKPPDNLFDLIIFDEAHHIPSKTWNNIHKTFEENKQIFFTATPFRRDNKKIIGKNIYSYPLYLAIEDNIFGDIRFEPVEAAIGEEDVKIAHKVEEVFNTDTQAGLNHKVLIRTDSKTKAKELLQVYNSSTNLKLKVIHSELSLRFVNKCIQELRDSVLDGIICVNMFGEGFDFPELKIAGIHAPHKSLEVTLQFIGRFARTNAENIGSAKFVSTTHDIEIEGTKLYDENINWQKIIVNLSDYKLFNEEYEKQTFEQFEVPQIASEKFKELSISSLKPFFHIQIFELDENIDIHKSLDFQEELVIEYKNVSPELNCAVYILSEVKDIKWIKQESYRYIAYDLVIVYFDPSSKLLVINSSKKEKILYEKIIQSFTSGNYKKISSKKVNRVFNDHDSFIIFNLGLNKKSSASSESYKILVGKNPSISLSTTDGNVYDSGHAMARVEKSGESSTIGASKNAKVWRIMYDIIPHFIKWIEMNLNKIKADTNIETRSRFDIIKPTEIINEIPSNIILSDWNKHVYLKQYLIKFDPNIELLDAQIQLILPYSSNKKLNFKITLNNIVVDYNFDIERTNLFGKTNSTQEDFILVNPFRDIPMTDFLNYYPLKFYTSDFKSIEGRELSSYNPTYINIEENCDRIDWDSNHVDIMSEITSSQQDKISIHEYLKSRLISENDVLIYDHGTQEMADFVCVKEISNQVLIKLYHCKGSKEESPGARVDDMYELIGQGIKSMNWIVSTEIFLKKIDQRTAVNPNKYLKGSRVILANLVEYTLYKEFKFEICLVQPGLSFAALKNNVALPINAATDFFKNNNDISFKLYCSE